MLLQGYIVFLTLLTTGCWSQFVFDPQNHTADAPIPAAPSCISTYQGLKTSLRSNSTGNVQKLLDVFYPPNMAPTHVVFVTYCVRKNATQNDFEMDSKVLMEEDYCNTTYLDYEFQWLTNTIPLLIDSDVFMANTFNLASLVELNLTLTINPFCEGIDGLALLDTLTVWLKSYAQSEEDTIKSYSITISDSVSDEGYLGLFAINGSKITFFEDRLLASGKKFVIGVWLGTSAITFALILHIGRVSPKTANALNRVLWDLTELVDKIIGLPQKFVGFIRKGPQQPAEPPEPTTPAPSSIGYSRRKSSVDALNFGTLPRKNRKESGTSTLEEAPNDDNSISDTRSLDDSSNDDQHDDEAETEMETMSMSINFRRKSSISVFEFPQVEINIENADNESEAESDADDGPSNNVKENDVDDSDDVLVFDQSAEEKTNMEKVTAKDGTARVEETVNNGIVDASDKIQAMEKTIGITDDDTTTDKVTNTTKSTKDVSTRETSTGTKTTTESKSVASMIDNDKSKSTVIKEANGRCLTETAGNWLSVEESIPVSPGGRDSVSRRSVQFNINEMSSCIIENNHAQENERKVSVPNEHYNTFRSTQSLVSYSGSGMQKKKLKHAFNHFAKSIQKFSTLSTMIVIAFLCYDIYIYVRFARKVSYDWLILFPFPFWMILVTLINIIAFITTECILFCSYNHRAENPIRTILYKIVSDFFITMSATTIPLFVLFHLFWSLLALSAFSIRLLSSATFYLPLVIFGLWLLAVVSNILKNWRDLIFLSHNGKKSDSKLMKVLRFIGKFLYPLIPLLFLPFWVLLLTTLNFFSDFMLEVVNLEEQSLLVVFGIIIVITIAARKIAKNCQPQYTEEDEEYDEEEEFDNAA